MTQSAGNTVYPSMPSDDDITQRVYQRLPRPYTVGISKLTFPMPKTPMYETTCCDISVGGVCVEGSGIYLQVGDTCQIKVHIPLLNKYSPGFFKVYENDTDQFFLALAEVAWVRALQGKSLLGFRFVNVDSDQQTALHRLVEKAFAVS